MKIIERLVEEMTLEEFADKHALVMEVFERGSALTSRGLPRFYAHFANAEESVAEGHCLAGTFGDGGSKEEAMQDYAKRISEKMLVIDARDKDRRREIRVPRIVGKK